MHDHPLLVIEDESVQREMMGFLLKQLVPDVELVGSLKEAEAALSARSFLLVIADYALPDGRVSQLLEQGLLETENLLVITGRDHVELPKGVEILRKPIDIERFRALVSKRFANDGPRHSSHFDEPNGAHLDQTELVVLRLLHTDDDEASSKRAYRRLVEALGGEIPSHVEVRVQNVRELEDTEQVLFTPCLVREEPRPRAWLVGDLADRASLDQLLRDSGIDPP